MVGAKRLLCERWEVVEAELAPLRDELREATATVRAYISSRARTRPQVGRNTRTTLRQTVPWSCGSAGMRCTAAAAVWAVL